MTDDCCALTRVIIWTSLRCLCNIATLVHYLPLFLLVHSFGYSTSWILITSILSISQLNMWSMIQFKSQHLMYPQTPLNAMPITTLILLQFCTLIKIHLGQMPKYKLEIEHNFLHFQCSSCKDASFVSIKSLFFAKLSNTKQFHHGSYTFYIIQMSI